MQYLVVWTHGNRKYVGFDIEKKAKVGWWYMLGSYAVTVQLTAHVDSITARHPLPRRNVK